MRWDRRRGLWVCAHCPDCEGAGFHCDLHDAHASSTSASRSFAMISSVVCFVRFIKEPPCQGTAQRGILSFGMGQFQGGRPDTARW
jgi:hypothetical protein